MFDHGGRYNKPMPVSNASRISHNAVAPNTPASTAGDSTRHLKTLGKRLSVLLRYTSQFVTIVTLNMFINCRLKCATDFWARS